MAQTGKSLKEKELEAQEESSKLMILNNKTKEKLIRYQELYDHSNKMIVIGNKLNKIAEVIVGITKFFFDIINIAMQVKNTISLIISSESAKTPAGNIIILPNNAARVE